MTVIGIDPGWSGGIAIHDGEALSLHKMPETYLKLWELLLPYAGIYVGPNDELQHHAVAYVENVHANSQNGCKANWSLSESLTTIRIALQTLCIPINLVSPQAWQKRLQPLPSGPGSYTARKREVKEKMKQSHPGYERKITNATADALAILEYGLEREGWGI